MKSVIAAAVLAAFTATTAQAQVMCNRSGDLTVCSDGPSFLHSGDTAFGSDGSSVIFSGNSSARQTNPGGVDMGIWSQANRPTVRSNNDYYGR